MKESVTLSYSEPLFHVPKYAIFIDGEFGFTGIVMVLVYQMIIFCTRNMNDLWVMLLNQI